MYTIDKRTDCTPTLSAQATVFDPSRILSSFTGLLASDLTVLRMSLERSQCVCFQRTNDASRYFTIPAERQRPDLFASLFSQEHSFVRIASTSRMPSTVIYRSWVPFAELKLVCSPRTMMLSHLAKTQELLEQSSKPKLPQALPEKLGMLGLARGVSANDVEIMNGWGALGVACSGETL